MTTKYLKLFTITTLISYLILFTFVSSSGLKHYYAIKEQVELQQKEIDQLSSDVTNLEKYKTDLLNGKYILDNAFKLGYVNEGDHVTFYEYSNDIDDPLFDNSLITNQAETKKVTKKSKSNAFFFEISIIIGLVISISFSLILKDKNNGKDEDKYEGRNF